MQQLYSLGERRSSRAGNFSFFQVHLLKLHVSNCTETSPEPERQQKATIRIVSCPALHALVLALNPSLNVASRKLVLHNQNMHLDNCRVFCWNRFQFTISTAHFWPGSRVLSPCGRTWGPTFRLLWKEVEADSHLHFVLIRSRKISTKYSSSRLEVLLDAHCPDQAHFDGPSTLVRSWHAVVCRTVFHIQRMKTKKGKIKNTKTPQRFQRSNFPRL